MSRDDGPIERLRAFDARYAAITRMAMKGMAERADALEATEDLSAWRRIAHQVRGIAPASVARLAQALEEAAAAEDRRAAALARPVLIRAMRRLAARTTNAQPSTPPSTAPCEASAKALVDGTAASARILVADDDPAIRRMVSLILRRRGGHEVVAVSDGDLAAQQLAEGEFDLALLDAMMPGRAGVDVARDARCTAVVLSAASPSELGLQEAPAHWWRKPLLADELLTRVDALLRELRGT